MLSSREKIRIGSPPSSLSSRIITTASGRVGSVRRACSTMLGGSRERFKRETTIDLSYELETIRFDGASKRMRTACLVCGWEVARRVNVGTERRRRDPVIVDMRIVEGLGEVVERMGEVWV